MVAVAALDEGAASTFVGNAVLRQAALDEVVGRLGERDEVRVIELGRLAGQPGVGAHVLGGRGVLGPRAQGQARAGVQPLQRGASLLGLTDRGRDRQGADHHLEGVAGAEASGVAAAIHGDGLELGVEGEDVAAGDAVASAELAQRLPVVNRDVCEHVPQDTGQVVSWR